MINCVLSDGACQSALAAAAVGETRRDAPRLRPAPRYTATRNIGER